MLLEKIPPFVKLVGWKYSFSGTSPHPHMSSRQKKWRGHRNQQKQSTNRAIGKQQLGFGVMPTKIVLLEIVEGPVLYTIISIHQQTSVPPPNSLTSFYLLKYPFAPCKRIWVLVGKSHEIPHIYQVLMANYTKLHSWNYTPQFLVTPIWYDFHPLYIYIFI